MNKYKIKQNKYTIEVVNLLGVEAKDKIGQYLLTYNNSAFFVDYKTNTLYKVPVSLVQ